MADRRMPARTLTEHLELRCWREQDASELRVALDECDAHLRPWIPFMQGEPRSLEQTRERLREARESFERDEHYRYAVRERTADALVGETMLLRRGGPDTLEAGYWLHQEHCGNGYATEATAALLPLAFDALRARRVIMRCDVNNHASLRVAARLGGRHVDDEHIVENDVSVHLQVLEILPR